MSKDQKTNQANEKIYLDGLRKLTGERRMEIASELFDAVKEVSRAGIRQQNPQISSKNLKNELRKRFSK